MNRSVIDQAIGIIISRSGSTTREASKGYGKRSQSEHIKVPIVAAHIVEGAARRAWNRTGTGRPVLVVTDRSNRLNARKGESRMSESY